MSVHLQSSSPQTYDPNLPFNSYYPQYSAQSNPLGISQTTRSNLLWLLFIIVWVLLLVVVNTTNLFPKSKRLTLDMLPTLRRETAGRAEVAYEEVEKEREDWGGAEETGLLRREGALVEGGMGVWRIE